MKPRAVKYKVIIGYLLLFSFAVAAVWFVYTEIIKVALPSHDTEENSKIIKISNTIANLYASEALARTAILSGSPEDKLRYNNSIDSITRQIQAIEEDAEPVQLRKFDSIQLLLERKRKSTADIIEYRKTTGTESSFRKAINGIYKAKDSIVRKTKPVKINKKYQWSSLVNSLLTPRQRDSLSKIISHDTLAMAFDDILTNLLVQDSRLQYKLYQKEQNLLDENRVISDRLRVLLAALETELIQNSYAEMRESQQGIAHTINTMAWAGAVALIVLILFAWVILNDLSLNHNYRKQLERLNTENEELLRTKSMLMATVTHDLQTPLGSIIGFSDLIDSSGINNKQQQYISNIKESADYILKLVNDLLDFSKLENNKITIEEVSFNVKTLIENTCMALVPTAINKNIELKWVINEDLDSNFISDPYRLKQVLTNLISNAIKFTSEGSVEVTGAIKNDLIHISVLDTGIGIAPEKQADVFKEFTQAHTGIEKKFGGTGLGLTISKRIIKLLGGTITLESKLAQGSLFTVTLPARHCTTTNTFSTTEACTDYSFLEDKKILVIDDDTTQLSLLKEIFSGYGAKVKTEANSTVAIAHLEQEEFDIILTDIQMPIMDGFDVVKTIRNHSKASITALPVIAMSGRKDLQIADYKASGFTAQHSKPINVSELMGIIAQLFGEKASNATSGTQQATSGELYSLKSLAQFTHNDPESLRLIIDTFIASAIDNCNKLQAAAKARDEQKIIQIAHKMIPMLKQMEVYSLVKLLDPLEGGELGNDWGAIDLRVTEICMQMEQLEQKLKEEAY